MKRLAFVLLVVAACKPSPSINREAQVTSASASSAATATSAAPTTSGDAHAALKMVDAEADSDALSTIRTERLKAKAEGRVLIVYSGAKWCEPCRRFKDEAHSGRLDGQLSKTTLLVFDADRDTERLAAAGYKFEFIPYVALPGPDGHPAEFNEARGKGSDSWKALVTSLVTWQSR